MNRKLRVYPLIIPGVDMCYGVTRANKLGYEVAPFPFTEDWPARALEECMIPTLNIVKGACKNDELVLFCVGNFCPIAPKGVIWGAIDKALTDWELLIFTCSNSHNEKSSDVHSDKGITWEPGISDENIVAILFRNHLVIDKYIETVGDKRTHLRDWLKTFEHAYSCTGLFSLFRRQKEKLKDRRLLAIISSYRRIKDACRQTYTFMDQSYDKYRLMLILRGISEYDWKRKLEPNFRHFIEEGRLIVRCEPNTTQLDHIAKFGEGVDRDSYDLICKIDDDDWYDRDYLKRVNAAHKQLPLEVSSMMTWIGGSFYQKDGIPCFSLGQENIWGGSMIVMSKAVQDIIREYVDKEYDAKVLLPLLGTEQSEWDWTWREDNLFHRLSEKVGYADRYHIDKGAPGIIVTRCGTSVTRSETSREWYINWKYRNVIHANINGQVKFLRIDGLKASEVGNERGMCGNILYLGDNELTLQSGEGGTPIVLRHQENGLWTQ